jgi:hypothetical protein
MMRGDYQRSRAERMSWNASARPRISGEGTCRWLSGHHVRNWAESRRCLSREKLMTLVISSGIGGTKQPMVYFSLVSVV